MAKRCFLKDLQGVSLEEVEVQLHLISEEQKARAQSLEGVMGAEPDV